MGSGQRQLRNPALAMDRQMSVSLFAGLGDAYARERGA